MEKSTQRVLHIGPGEGRVLDLKTTGQEPTKPTLTVVPNELPQQCPHCGAELMVFWNGNLYCSETFNQLKKNPDGECPDTDGWEPVIKLEERFEEPEKEIRRMFGPKPKNHFGPANKDDLLSRLDSRFSTIWT